MSLTTNSGGTILAQAARFAAALTLTAIAVTGCAPGSVAVPVPSASVGLAAAATGRVAAVCAALHAALPAQVLGGRRRDTTPTSDRTAAWGGDPTVTLSCGVGRPDRAGSSADVIEINGTVRWLPLPAPDGGFDLYPAGRSVWIRLHVPPTSRNPVGAASDLTPAVAARVPPAATAATVPPAATAAAVPAPGPGAPTLSEGQAGG